MFARELLRQVGDLLGCFVDWQGFNGKEEKGVPLSSSASAKTQDCAKGR